MLYDFFVAGRTRNKTAVNSVADSLREAGKKVYCFLDNNHESAEDGVSFAEDSDPEQSMKAFEAITDWQSNKFVREIFDADMDALKESDSVIVVLPAGKSAHIEAGVAYGLGKPTYAVGEVNETESLYLIFKEIFPNTETLVNGVARG